MGTNYYWRENECECCNRYDNFHIGKSSYGWEFNFKGYNEQYYMNDDYVYSKYQLDLTSWKKYKEFLIDKTIYDEYGKLVPYDEFVTMIETYKSPGYVRDDGHINTNHIDYILSESRYYDVREEYNNPEFHWKDDLGYAFTVKYFS
jgi:hypothetical protein